MINPENLTIEELDQLIGKTRQEKTIPHWKAYMASLASLPPELQKLRENLLNADSEYIEPLLKLREEKLLQQKIEQAKKDDPFIKEVPSGSGASPKASATIPALNQKRHHYLLPLIKKALAAKCHTWLVGPAGSGKSTVAATAAAELKMRYAALSVCSQTTKTDLLGYLDAQGVYRSTSFRDIYENGGVFCLDEIDNGNANVLAVLNSALSGDTNVFPDKMVNKHKDFVVIACANTFGLGSSISYVGRTQIDAATLDRFFFVEMPYDDGLEAHVAGVGGVASPQWNEAGKTVPSVQTWLNLVKKAREAISDLGVKAIISPRATYNGIALIKQGVPLYFLEKGLLYKSMSQETVAKVRQA